MKEQIIEIEDITDDQLPLYFRGNEYYPPSELTDNTIKDIGNIRCTRYYYPWQEFNNSHDEAEELLTRKLNVLLKPEPGSSCTAVFIEEWAEYKSRIRTYRGWIKKGIISDNAVISYELPLKDNLTFFCGLINMKNLDSEVFTGIYINAHWFYLIGPEANFTAEFLMYIVDNYVNREKRNCFAAVNINLIVDLCTKGNKVIKLGGDWQSYQAIDMFYKAG